MFERTLIPNLIALAKPVVFDADALNAIAFNASLETGLARTERALAKLDEGTYGVCDACGAAIPPARLQAMPDSVLCVTCAAAERRVHAPRRR